MRVESVVTAKGGKNAVLKPDFQKPHMGLMVRFGISVKISYIGNKTLVLNAGLSSAVQTVLQHFYPGPSEVTDMKPFAVFSVCAPSSSRQLK